MKTMAVVFLGLLALIPLTSTYCTADYANCIYELAGKTSQEAICQLQTCLKESCGTDFKEFWPDGLAECNGARTLVSPPILLLAGFVGILAYIRG